MLAIEPVVIHTEVDFNSNSPISWKEIREGNIIDHKGTIYEVAFKSVRKSAVDGYLLESHQILYLRPLSQGENVTGEIDEHDHFSLMMPSISKNIGTGKVSPCTASFHESWTEEHLNSLKKELNEKIEKIRSLLQ